MAFLILEQILFLKFLEKVGVTDEVESQIKSNAWELVK
jgi:hypothetical protein